MKKFFLALFLLPCFCFQPIKALDIPNPPATLYLDLIKRAVLDTLHRDREDNIFSADYPQTYDLGDCQSMLNYPRLQNLQNCVEDVLRNNVPGDLIETGVWRGGCTILMRAILKAYGDTERTVWVADSFAGLPKPNAKKYPMDLRYKSYTGNFAVAIEDVKRNFSRYNLLDDQVRFLKGWFKDTLPTAPINQLAIMRLDGDFYESTIDALASLYPKLSIGGYVIIDDYFSFSVCAEAVEHYRTLHNITDPIHVIDWTAVYWQRTK